MVGRIVICKHDINKSNDPTESNNTNYIQKGEECIIISDDPVLINGRKLGFNCQVKSLKTGNTSRGKVWTKDSNQNIDTCHFIFIEDWKVYQVLYG